MKISSRLDYALSCVLRVADKYGSKEATSVTEIAEKENIEHDYAEQLLILMKKARLLKSVRGPGGGYILAKSPETINAGAIVKAIEGQVLEVICFRKKGRKNKCAHINDCRVRKLWIEFKDCMEAFLKKRTLRELLDMRRKEKNWQNKENTRRLRIREKYEG